MSVAADGSARREGSRLPDGSGGSFWDHLEELRLRLLRVLLVTILIAVIAYFLKYELFAIVLAPRSSDFITYRLLSVDSFAVGLMNTGLTEQFFIHLRISFYAGLLVASPYVLYEVFAFVSPALYESERNLAVPVVFSAYVMSLLGILLNYFLVFPLTVRFLGTYQVSPDVANMLTLQSYIDTLISMSFVMALLFELPVVFWLLGRMGIISCSWMAEYRRHAVVAIMVVAAIVTPTTDGFTLFLVALPIWLLYEVSILVVRFGGGR